MAQEMMDSIAVSDQSPRCCADTAEMAPPKWRGRLNTIVQCGTITGIVVGSAINIGAYHILWGWRLSLALAAVPGSILLLGKPISTL